MPVKILMPALSPTMTEGALSSWLKKEGDPVTSGDVLAEIETDKATMEVEAVDEGTLARILVPAGTDGVAVNSVIALMLEDGEDAGALDAAVATVSAAAPPPPAAEPAADPPKPTPTNAPAGAATPGGGRIFASPLARRLAQAAGLDLASISGSGPNGRIVKADVEAAGAAPKPATVPKTTAAAPPAPAPAAPPTPGADAKALADAYGMPYREIKNTSMRKVIARRLTEAKQTVPHFYLTVDCRLDALLALRKDLNAKGAEDGIKLSVNDLIIKAAALALRKIPEANASWTDQAILEYENVDISVAVATDGGLITPIIRNADIKGLAAISAEMKDLAGRARSGKLAPEDYQGGTFSISNLGMFGVRDFSAIINPPQGCILAVGAGEARPVAIDGAVVIATVMSVTLSVDHRVVDGAVGARLLQAFKAIIEDPMRIML